MMTSSPGLSTARSVDSIVSVEPQHTVTCRSGSTAMPYNARYLSAMARRRDGVPHVIAYWWKSPSMARCAASRSSFGGAKFGMPWARLTPPCWFTTRVISRMTDSVKPCTRSDMRLMAASAASGDRGHDGHLVAVLERGGARLQEADVLLVDVDVDEAPQGARLVDEPLLETGELALEVGEHLVHGITL